MQLPSTRRELFSFYDSSQPASKLNRPRQLPATRYACGPISFSFWSTDLTRGLKESTRMKGVHPSVNAALMCALAAATIGVAGCRSSSSSAINPLMAPDRVPPPSTRAIAPGQAQPYYQGDPLPVMQSSTSPSNNPALASDATALSSTGKTLAWNAPASASNGNAASSANSPWDAKPQLTTPIAYGNEPPVSVPSDGGELRFAAPVASSPTPAAAGTSGSTTPLVTSAAPQPTTATTSPGATSNQGVAQASYNAPVTSNSPAAGGLTPVLTTPELSPTPQVASPWRTPQVANVSAPAQTSPFLASSTAPTSTIIPPVPFYVMGQPPTVLPTNAMPVEIRAVPSPPPQPGDPLPRVRVPSYEVPQTATADGFRPRTSMR